MMNPVRAWLLGNISKAETCYAWVWLDIPVVRWRAANEPSHWIRVVK